jgi:hypothetical protein
MIRVNPSQAKRGIMAVICPENEHPGYPQRTATASRQS